MSNNRSMPQLVEMTHGHPSTLSPARGAQMRSNGSPLQPFHGVLDARDRSRQVVHHELRLEAQHMEPKPPELFIAPSVGAPPVLMRFAIYFDHELKSWSQEIHNESAADWHLALEGHPELARGERLPEPPLRNRERRPETIRKVEGWQPGTVVWR